MKFLQVHISILLLALLVLSGCYTQYNATSTDVNNDAEYLGEGWFSVYDIPFFIDPTTRQWYLYYGIDLTTDKNFLASLPFRYHHRTSTYFYSPFRSSFFYNYPGYSDQYFFRTGGVRPWYAINSIYHPPFYSNQYMWSFYYNRWANTYHWQSSEPNFGRSGQIASNNSNTLRGTSVSGTNSGSRSGQVSSRLSSDRDELFSVSSRNRIAAPSIERVTLNERQENVRDRRGSDYRSSLGSRSSRSPLSSWSDWEQRNSNSAGVSRSAGNARTVNRAPVNRSSDGSTVRGASGRNGSSGGATRSSGSSRSSGEGSSSRGSN